MPSYLSYHPSTPSTPLSLPLALLHVVVCTGQCSSLRLFHPVLPLCVRTSVLYVCVSILALQIGSSVAFF